MCVCVCVCVCVRACVWVWVGVGVGGWVYVWVGVRVWVSSLACAPMQSSKEQRSSFDCDENDDIAMDATSEGRAPTRKRQHDGSLRDVEDLGSAHGRGKGKGVHRFFTVNKKSKESVREETGHKSWRQVLGPPPPRGTSKVCKAEGVEVWASGTLCCGK